MTLFHLFHLFGYKLSYNGMDTKDIYSKLTEYEDNKTVLSMLSVNKKFNDPEFFKSIFSKRYPQLVKYKTDDEDWKQFYLIMIYYISKLNEDFDYDYINDAKYKIVKTENPEEIYNELMHFKAHSHPRSILNQLQTLKNLENEDFHYDVSDIREDGTHLMKIKTPGYISKKKKVKGYNIYSNNLKGIIITAKLLGDYRIISLWE